MTEKQKIAVNLFSTVCNFAVTVLIGLAVTPYLVGKLGGEAYGFIGLANSFVGYAALMTIALNSMAGRFISVAIFSKKYEDASKYFTSVLYSNLLLACLLAPVLALVVWKLPCLVSIPAPLVTDVKIAFALTFVQFLLQVVTSGVEVAAFVSNRLYLPQRNGVIGSLLRLATIFVCFALFSVRISYLTLGSLLGAMFVCGMNIYYTRTFLPQLKIGRRYFEFACVRQLLASGVWNLVNRLSGVLLDDLDLLISNVMIGSAPMGALALSKTVPAMFVTLRGTLDYPFAPPMTRCYARQDLAGVIRYARMGNKLLGVFLVAPMAAFAVYGMDFFRLWVPGEDHRMLHLLSLLAIASLLAGACINSVFTVFSITNKVRIPSLVMLATGILTVITNFVLLHTTNWGVYIIAGVSSLYALLRNFIFTPLYGAHCLHVKWSTFYHEIFTGNVCLLLNIAAGCLLHRVLRADTWPMLILSAGILVVCSVVINAMVVLSRAERQAVLRTVHEKWQVGKG